MSRSTPATTPTAAPTATASALTSGLDVLAMEPFYGGSHRAFLERWAEASQHRWTILQLPPHKWKWRMRHSALTFAEQAAERYRRGERWQAVFCSDMLNLAEWKGLAPPQVRDLPVIGYFHENQLTYPVRNEAERDLHFALTNMSSALAADRVWFNSKFHRDSFLEALARLLRRMPDHRLPEVPELIRQRSEIWPQGIQPSEVARSRAMSKATSQSTPGKPLHILWAARWEFDKNPEDFFAALELLSQNGEDFRLSVIGEQFRQVPEVFAQARQRFAQHIERWGYQSRAEYQAALAEADVFVATAHHEFFGVSAAEAIASGCWPLLPQRLAYPELLSEVPAERRHEFLYDGSPEQLAKRLQELMARHLQGDSGSWREVPELVPCVERFMWQNLRPRLDAALAAVADRQPV